MQSFVAVPVATHFVKDARSIAVPHLGGARDDARGSQFDLGTARCINGGKRRLAWRPRCDIVARLPWVRAARPGAWHLIRAATLHFFRRAPFDHGTALQPSGEVAVCRWRVPLHAIGQLVLRPLMWSVQQPAAHKRRADVESVARGRADCPKGREADKTSVQHADTELRGERAWTTRYCICLPKPWHPSLSTRGVS